MAQAFSVYAIAYPFLVLVAGMRWPRMPSFGVPCPTTLLTVGLLLGMEPRQLRGLAPIPFLWCLIGGSAAFTLRVRPDWMLFPAALALAIHALAPGRLSHPGQSPAGPA